jgi:hypothetical protein
LQVLAILCLQNRFTCFLQWHISYLVWHCKLFHRESI